MLLKFKVGDTYTMPTNMKKLACFMKIRQNENVNRSISSYQGEIIFIKIKESIKKIPACIQLLIIEFQNILSKPDRPKGTK